MEEERKRDEMFSVAEIVKRAKLAMGFRRDSELAAYLGVSRSTLSNWVARNSIDYPLLLGRLSEVDYNWLLTGKGSPLPQHDYCDSELASGPVERLHQSKTPEVLDDRRVPLFDIRAAANLKTLLEDRPQYALGEIVIPNVPSCDGAIYISGDSMYPILKPGYIVGFRYVTDFSTILYGEMYLVSFRNGDEDYLVVKYVNKSSVSGRIILSSYNPNHGPIELSLEQVRSMAIVKFSIRKHLMM